MTGITWNSAAWDDEDMEGVNGGATEQSRGAAEQQSGRSSGAAGQRSSGAEDVSGSV